LWERNRSAGCTNGTERGLQAASTHEGHWRTPIPQVKDDEAVNAAPQSHGSRGSARIPHLTSVLERNARSPVKFSDSMTPDLGKLLYPRLQPDQRRREMHFLLTALLTGLLTASIIAVVIIAVGEKHLR